MSSLATRMIRAARLDPALYEEVEADVDALPQAMLVILLTSLAAGIGSLGLGSEAANVPVLRALLLGTVAAFLSWYVLAVIVYLVGTRLLPGPATQADIGQLLRTTGFSASPGVLRILGVLAGDSFRVALFAVVGVWMLVALVIAVRHALDYETTGRAAAVCLISLVIEGVLLLPAAILMSVWTSGSGEMPPGAPPQ